MAVRPETQQGLHVCKACFSELVQPEWWEECGGGSWRVGLRCPECEHREEGVFARGVVDAFDAQLDDGIDELTAAYRRVLRENLAEELERLAGALAADALLPEDF
jgi:hypothetical protein